MPVIPLSEIQERFQQEMQRIKEYVLASEPGETGLVRIAGSGIRPHFISRRLLY